MTLRVLDSTTEGRPVLPAPRPQPAFLRTAQPARVAAGFYAREVEGLIPFCWMGLQGTLELEPRPEACFLEARVFSEFYDLSQEIAVTVGDTVQSYPLAHGWSQLSITVAAGISEVRLRVNKLFPPSYYPEDDRQLAVRISAPHTHVDAQRHADIDAQYRNAVLNTREMLDGAAIMQSTPISLGIDLHGVCNVKPPCVYCDWDGSKNAEGDHVETPFTLETVEEWGVYYRNASSLVNCSVGEPFLMKNIDELFDEFSDRGKFLEITTNGQILTERNIQRLLGRNIHLYISLDAATPETYAKLRNDRLDTILTNLRLLIERKGGRDGSPKIFLVFMPMRCNVHELDDFVRLCAELEVDRMILRPLDFVEQSDLNWQRAGYEFRYVEELLPFDELVRVSARAAALCERYGVPLSDQLDFGGKMGSLYAREFERTRAELRALEEPRGEAAAAPADEAGAINPEVAGPASDEGEAAAAPPPSLGADRLPACAEPWKSFYILRRGATPCCYGHAPLADMDAFRGEWNSKTMQGIRRELAAGRFHDYCLKSTSCPIVRKGEHLGQISHEELAYSRRRSAVERAKDLVNMAGFGLPRRIWRSLH